MRTSNLNNLGLAILRISFSSLMLVHGLPRINMLFGGGEIKFPGVLGLSPTLSLILTIIGEVVCPILIIIGFKTKWAAIPAFITMFVAGFVYLGGQPLAKKELALLYMFAFLAISFLGAGKYSLDGLMGKNR